MNKRTILVIAFLLFSVETIALYWFKFGFDNILLRELLYLVPPFFAMVAGIVALFTFGFANARSLTFILLTAGVSYWFFGELLFAYYQYILHVDSYPSAADFFYVLAYPMFFAGLINEIRIAQINWKGISKPTLFLLTLVGLLLGVIVGYFGIYQAYAPDEPLLSNLVAIGYGVGDLLLVLITILLLVLVWEFRGGKMSKVWLLLFGALIMTLVADILFARFSNEYTMQVWFYKSLLDSFWMAGYLFFAFAFFELSFSLEDSYHKAIAQAQDKGLLEQRPAVQTQVKPDTNQNL